MADASRSLESILAALAQQRPNTTTPSGGQPQHPSMSYPQATTPNAYPAPMPPAPGVGGSGHSMTYASAPGQYPLPQPSSSGNLDLSAIKPVNSGTVSITDAIAQAKAYATEKGLSSYDLSRGPQSYQANDSAAHYRSRSRSPPARRDAFRDNYNPYRDERRDDGRGARDYGRSRSRSPRGRAHTAHSAHSHSAHDDFSSRGGGSHNRGGGGGSGTDAGTDEDSEIMQIESSLVGLIIGRQGENLRRVEGETGCRVQFLSGPDNQGQYRQCRITGPRAGRAQAKASINSIVEDSGMSVIARGGGQMKTDTDRSGIGSNPPNLREGEDCMQIMVPDRTVGLIIGRGGETIRDLQEKSGCHINIVGESKSINGLRPVNLIGTSEAAAMAKEQIMEIVDSDNRNMSGASAAAPVPAPKPERYHKNDHGRDAGRDAGRDGNRDGDKINDSIYVPSEAVGMIIGKGGETIREMQNNTGCKINVSQSSGPGEVEREIGLVGSRDSINLAKRAIEDKVDAVRQKNTGGGSGANGGGRSGGRNPNRRDYDNPNYNQQASHNQMNSSTTGAQQQSSTTAGGPDPYAAYGGYQAYVALWYQALAQQGQTGGQSQGAPPPPGV